MTNEPHAPEICPLGVDGILVRFSRTLNEEDNARALAFRRRVIAAEIQGVTEVSSSLVSVRVAFDHAVTTRAAVTDAVTVLLDTSSDSAAGPRRFWRIPVAFGQEFAPQLAEAAALAGITSQQVVDAITATQVRVMAIGFAPGQPYLGLLPKHLDTPRQSELTDGLPRGALVTAVRQLIIWAADAPTGWRHIGQTAFQVYRPDAQHPFAFEPGDAVKFVATSDMDLRALQSNTDTNGGATCEVLGP